MAAAFDGELPRNGLRLVVAHSGSGLIVNVEELVRHDRGHAVFRNLVVVLFQRYDSCLPAYRELFENCRSGGHERFIGALRVHTQLEAFHDPGIAVGIVNDHDRGAFGGVSHVGAVTCPGRERRRGDHSGTEVGVPRAAQAAGAGRGRLLMAAGGSRRP